MRNSINPVIDIAFKKIFGVDENKDLLISLINSIVSSEDQVQDLTLLNPYNPQHFRSDKLSILDIKALSVEGKRYNIEIQLLDESDYDKRALYYWAKLYTEQLQSGQDYADLSKAIGIHILNFTSILESQKYHNIFHVLEKETLIPYFKDLELHTIELKKFTGLLNQDLTHFVDKIKTSLDRWLTFLTRHELFDQANLPPALKDSNLKKAVEVLNIMNFSEEERDLYEDHLKMLRMEMNALKKVEERGREAGKIEGREEGRIEGIGIGMEMGRQEGEMIGEERGRKEGEVKMAESIAIKLLESNADLAHIRMITGLSEEALQKLQSQNAEKRNFAPETS